MFTAFVMDASFKDLTPKTTPRKHKQQRQLHTRGQDREQQS